MSDAAAPAAAPAAAGPSNIDDPLEREKWIEEAIENDPVLVRRRDIIKVLSNESTAKMAQVNEMNAQLKQLEKMHGELTHPKASKNTALAKSSGGGVAVVAAFRAAEPRQLLVCRRRLWLPVPAEGLRARFHQWPPEKQRVLSCFSPAAAAALGGGGRAAPCWRPACLSGDAAEASVRVHHFGWHTFAPSSRLVDDTYALEWARARGFPLR